MPIFSSASLSIKKIRVEYKFYIFILNANQQNIFFSNIYCHISGVLGEKTELTVEDKYKRTMEEIESLKVELGIFICTTKRDSAVDRICQFAR